MKRFLALLLCFCIVFSLAACGEEETTSRRKRTKSNEEQEEVTIYGTYYLESSEGDFTPCDAVIILEGGIAYACYTDNMTYNTLFWWEDGRIGVDENSVRYFEADGDNLIISNEDTSSSMSFVRGEELDISAYSSLDEETTDNEEQESTTSTEHPIRNDADFDGTLTIGLPKSSLVTDYNENVYTKWLEEQTGYNIEFQFFAASSSDYKTQLNTMIAGKLELPDILFSMNLGQTMYERCCQDGVLVDVSGCFNDPQKSAAFREQMSKLSAETQENTWRRMQSHDGSGAIYVFPEVQESQLDRMDYQVWINREWLDTLNLDMPTDPDSLYDVLDSYYKQRDNYNPPEDQLCPLLVWPENYKDQLPTQRSDCPSVITKYRNDFISGNLDINSDNDWNSYLTQLKNVGVDDWQYYAQLVYNETVGVSSSSGGFFS